MKTMDVTGVLAVLLVAAGAAWAQAPGAAAQPAATARPDIVLADFEGLDYGDWKVTGEAFGSGPRQGDNSIWPYQGTRFAWSMNKGDQSVGTLTSPEFKIDRRYITFLISGGNAHMLTMRKTMPKQIQVQSDKPGSMRTKSMAGYLKITNRAVAEAFGNVGVDKA